MCQKIGNVFTLKIAAFGNIISRAKGLCFCLCFCAQNGLNLGLVPDIKLALFALRIGVEAGRKCAFGRHHIAHEPRNGFGNTGGKKRFLCVAIKRTKPINEQRIVIKHFLKMRHQPIRINAIAGKAPADMIVNPALTDFARAHQNRLAHGGVAAQLGLLP